MIFIIEVYSSTMKNVQIINKIIEIEAGAQELIKNAKQEQTELPLKIARILDEHKEEYQAKAVERIKNARVQEDENAKAKIGQIMAAHIIKLDGLKKMADENTDGWIDKIYNFITKPTDISI